MEALLCPIEVAIRLHTEQFAFTKLPVRECGYKDGRK